MVRIVVHPKLRTEDFQAEVKGNFGGRISSQPLSEVKCWGIDGSGGPLPPIPPIGRAGIFVRVDAELS